MYRIRIWEDSRPEIVFFTQDLARGRETYDLWISRAKDIGFIEIALEQSDSGSPFEWDVIASEVVA
jgi:hypothetical protein